MNGSPGHLLLVDVLSRKAGVGNTSDGLVGDGHGHRGNTGAQGFGPVNWAWLGMSALPVACVSLCVVCVCGRVCAHCVSSHMDTYLHASESGSVHLSVWCCRSLPEVCLLSQ